MQRKLFFHVVADSPKLYSRLVNRTRAWPENFRNKLKFVQHEVGKRPIFPMCCANSNSAGIICEKKVINSVLIVI